MRMHDESGKIEAKGGITIAFQTEGNKTFFAIAKCNDENYKKDYGRAKSAGRLKAKNVNFIVYDVVPKTGEIVDNLKALIYYEEEKYNPDVRNFLY